MFGAATPYVMSVTMMMFSGLSALCLFAFIRSLDPPEEKPQDRITKHAA